MWPLWLEGVEPSAVPSHSAVQLSVISEMPSRSDVCTHTHTHRHHPSPAICLNELPQCLSVLLPFTFSRSVSELWPQLPHSGVSVQQGQRSPCSSAAPSVSAQQSSVSGSPSAAFLQTSLPLSAPSPHILFAFLKSCLLCEAYCSCLSGSSI